MQDGLTHNQDGWLAGAASQGASVLLHVGLQQKSLSSVLGDGRSQESESGSSRASRSLGSRSHTLSLLTYVLAKASHKAFPDSMSKK